MAPKPLKIMVSRAGLEPATTALKVRIRGVSPLLFGTFHVQPVAGTDRDLRPC